MKPTAQHRDEEHELLALLGRESACDGHYAGYDHSEECDAVHGWLSRRDDTTRDTAVATARAEGKAEGLREALRIAQGEQDDWDKDGDVWHEASHAAARHIVEGISDLGTVPQVGSEYERGLEMAIGIAELGPQLEADGPCCRECYYLDPAGLRTHKTVEALRAAHDAAIRAEVPTTQKTNVETDPPQEGKGQP